MAIVESDKRTAGPDGDLTTVTVLATTGHATRVLCPPQAIHAIVQCRAAEILWSTTQPDPGDSTLDITNTAFFIAAASAPVSIPLGGCRTGSLGAGYAPELLLATSSGDPDVIVIGFRS